MIRLPSLFLGRWSPADLLDLVKPKARADGFDAANALNWLRDNAPGELYYRVHEQKLGRSKPRGERTQEQITGETWHQTAIGPGHLGYRSILKVPAHDVVDFKGGIHLLWDPRVVLWTSHALNKFTIGHEIDCRACGVEGDESTFWRSKKEKAAGKQPGELIREATDIQLEAARALSGYYQRLLGGDLEQWTHRQGHKSRTTDPGSRIYQGVILKLGQPHDPEATHGSGKPIPEHWRRR